MITAASLFSTLASGQTVDLAGETIQGSNVDSVPDNVTVTNGIFDGQTQIYGAKGLTISDCGFKASTDDKLQGLLRMLGGSRWTVDNCHFVGGVVASQLGVGLNSRVTGSGGCPVYWAVKNCVFDPLSGQWGTYPQGHNIYVLTTPSVNMNATIDRCDLSGSPFGAALKLGGTGNQPQTEGTKGVLVTNSTIAGQQDGANRCLAVLTQGLNTDVTLRNCVLEALPGSIPWVQGMDGARCRMELTQLPLGVTEYATWFYLRVFKKEKKVTTGPDEKPPNIGGISWTL